MTKKTTNRIATQRTSSVILQSWFLFCTFSRWAKYQSFIACNKKQRSQNAPPLFVSVLFRSNLPATPITVRLGPEGITEKQNKLQFS